MKTISSQLPIASFCLSALFCLATLPAARGQVPSSTPPPGPPKVRIIVKENIIMTTAGGSLGGSTPKPAAAVGNAPLAKLPPAASEADKFTRTTKKSLDIALVNLTTASMDVNVKTTFLAKDEAGKHEVLPEKTVDNKVTLQPGAPQSFTTEEVSFTHTAAHRPVVKAAKPTGRGPVATVEPASGHAYFGYKVEVFQGNDLVGTALSDTAMSEIH